MHVSEGAGDVNMSEGTLGGGAMGRQRDEETGGGAVHLKDFVKCMVLCPHRSPVEVTITSCGCKHSTRSRYRMDSCGRNKEVGLEAGLELGLVSFDTCSGFNRIWPVRIECDNRSRHRPAACDR